MSLLAVLLLVSQQPTPVVALERRASIESVLVFQVAEGHHVQANPASHDFLVATKLDLEDGCGVVVGEPAYPPAQAFRLEGTDQDLAVWEESFTIAVPLRVRRFARRGDCVLRGSLTFQACDLRRCFAPASIDIELPIRIR